MIRLRDPGQKIRRPPAGYAAPALVALSFLLPAAASAWTLDLADTVRVESATVRVADVARGPVPAAAGAVVVASGGRPGAEVTVSARAILRRLALAGHADGLVLAGAARCRIIHGGVTVERDALIDAVREAIAPGLPPAEPEAPPSWLAISMPEIAAQVRDDWRVTWPQPRTLEPGRNLVTLALHDGPRVRRLSVVAEAHVYARTAMATTAVGRDQTVAPETVQWAWTDLATAAGDPVTDPRILESMIAARELAPGQTITHDALTPRPLVRRGQPVDLVVRRGRVEASVRAECRQDGRLGQLVSVRNQIDGRLVVARVAGPGLVTLGR